MRNSVKEMYCMLLSGDFPEIGKDGVVFYGVREVVWEGKLLDAELHEFLTTYVVNAKCKTIFRYPDVESVKISKCTVDGLMKRWIGCE